MKKLDLEQMENVEGGVYKEEYCGQLYDFLDWYYNGTGDFQGDINMVLEIIR